MIPVKIRSSQGCWTCRLRRKKCDERKPVCSICGALEITCHFSDKRPEWMDGGEKERQTSDDLKAMVKNKANERRERRWAALDGTNTDEDVEMDDISLPPEAHRHVSVSDTSVSPPLNSADRSMPRTSNMVNKQSTNPVTPMDDSFSSDRSPNQQDFTTSGPNIITPASSSAGSQAAPEVSGSEALIGPFMETFGGDRSEHEINLTMIYLDYVVPFLFPFYRPCILESGRGWLLLLLMRNKALFHTALSIASYLYSVLLDSQGVEQGPCQRANWAELQVQQDMSLRALQRDINNLNNLGVAVAFDESMRCLESIIQLLQFEVAIANTENWQVHHEAAVVLFEQLLANHATDCEKPWYSVLRRMGMKNLEVTLAESRHPWTSGQSAYRFYSANLLWIDIIASTASETVPKLASHHAELLEGDKPPLLLEGFIGCPNWTVLLIADIAVLAAWKKDMRATGSLSVVELVRRASLIEEKLRRGVDELEKLFPATGDLQNVFDPSAQPPQFLFSGLRFEMMAHGDPRSHAAQVLHAKIWTQAALTYLAVVVSGWQPLLPEIRTSVETTMDLFRAMANPLPLRTLVWPFAITGCVATPAQESFFTELVSSLGAMQVFGTVHEALNIMQEVWKRRGDGCGDAQGWDIAACLSILGHRALLV